jgi:hypothetical protein
LIAPDLIVDVILFAIQLILLSLRDVAAIDPGIALLLPNHASIFTLQLTIVSVQVALVGIDSVVDVVTAMQHFRSARMSLSKRSRPTSTAG